MVGRGPAEVSPRGCAAVVVLSLLLGCGVEIVPLGLNHPANPAAEEAPPLQVRGPVEDEAATGGSGEEPGPTAGTAHPTGHAGMGDTSGGQGPAGARERDTAPDGTHDQGGAAAAPDDHHPSAAPPEEPDTHDHGAGSAEDAPDDDHHQGAAPPDDVSTAQPPQKTPFPLLQRMLPGLAGARDLHPMFVHFPIALWSAALLFWVLGVARTAEPWLTTARWLTTLALLGAAASVATGLLAEERLGHDSPGHDVVHVHKYFMLATTAAGLVTALVAWLTRKRGPRWAWTWGASLIVTVALMILGADRGGLLVFGHGVGTTSPGEGPGGAPGSERASEQPAHGSHRHP